MITDYDYGLQFWIKIMDYDYVLRLQITITDYDYGLRIRLWITIPYCTHKAEHTAYSGIFLTLSATSARYACLLVLLGTYGYKID